MPHPAPPPVELPIPASWYCLGFSEDVPVGVVVPRRIAGRELVLFRDRDGQLAALDAYCPHLGAWLGQGTIEDGALRCPFHGFRFDAGGACVSTPYGGKVPPACRAETWIVAETNGLLLVWYAPAGEPPRFEIPPIDRAAWTAWRHHRFELRGHPQEVAENSVDVGHFAAVHPPVHGHPRDRAGAHGRPAARRAVGVRAAGRPARHRRARSGDRDPPVGPRLRDRRGLARQWHAHPPARPGRASRRAAPGAPDRHVRPRDRRARAAHADAVVVPRHPLADRARRGRRDPRVRRRRVAGPAHLGGQALAPEPAPRPGRRPDRAVPQVDAPRQFYTDPGASNVRPLSV